jgi:microcystin-dependent protein
MIDTAIRAEREREHPVGSLWIREADIDPAAYFGFGTWQRVEGRMIMGASAQYPAGSTGGSATHKHATQGHTLIVSEMPAHNHPVSGSYSNNPFYVRYQEDFGYGSYGGPTPNRLHVTNTVQTEGGNQPHDHGDTTDGSSMNPYIAVYIWQRVA